MESLWVVILAGAIATAASLAALRASVSMKRAQGSDSGPLAGFWISVAAYMAMFTILRVAALGGLGDGVLYWLFILQTLAGASTLISLLGILFGILIGRAAGRLAMLAGAAAATVTVALIVLLGVDGPRFDAWSLEFLPRSLAARAAVGAFYVVTPVAMCLVVLWGTHKQSRGLRLRVGLFAASVMLMYVPNAGKYTMFIEGPYSAMLGIVMAFGAILGWLSYVVTAAGENG